MNPKLSIFYMNINIDWTKDKWLNILQTPNETTLSYFYIKKFSETIKILKVIIFIVSTNIIKPKAKRALSP